MPNMRFANNDEAIAYMKDVAVAGSGFSRFLNVEPLICWEGKAEVLLKVRDDMTQHHGFVHGAIVGLMADNSCAWAAASLLGDVVTGGYTVNFLAPAKGAHLRAKAQVVKAGKRQAVVRADIWSETKGEKPVHVAAAQATIVPTGR